jgi:hypothetical protein
VDYWSESQKKWIKATVTNVDQKGSIQVDVKPLWWIDLDCQAERIRRRRADFPPGFVPFEQGERAEYRSDTHHRWVPCVVLAVDSATGAVQLDVKPGFWMEPQVMHSKVRRCRPDNDGAAAAASRRESFR